MGAYLFGAFILLFAGWCLNRLGGGAKLIGFSLQFAGAAAILLALVGYVLTGLVGVNHAAI